MNKLEFIQELKDNNLYTDEFKVMYEKFCFYQDLAWETLVEFCRICDKNNIFYQLAWGSLLGAIRDDGQIPWDYDIDVFVKHYEMPKLVNALKVELNSKYYVHSPEFANDSKHYLMRIYPKGYDSDSLHVDVFSLIGTSSDENARISHAKSVKRVCLINNYKSTSLNFNQQPNLKAFVKKLINKMRYMYISKKSNNIAYENTINKYYYNKSNYVIVGNASSCSNYFYKRKQIDETTSINLNDNVFRIPVHYETILKEQYGDYSKVPPLQSRVDEIMRSCQHFDNSEKIIKKNGKLYK